MSVGLPLFGKFWSRNQGLLEDVISCVNKAILYTFDNLLALHEVGEIFSEDLLPMARAIQKEVDRRVYKVLIYLSQLSRNVTVILLHHLADGEVILEKGLLIRIFITSICLDFLPQSSGLNGQVLEVSKAGILAVCRSKTLIIVSGAFELQVLHVKLNAKQLLCLKVLQDLRDTHHQVLVLVLNW